MIHLKLRDRRPELPSHTRQQIISLALDLTALTAYRVEEALSYLYASDPQQWQAFMDQASKLLQAACADRSGFADTAQPGAVGSLSWPRAPLHRWETDCRAQS